MRELEKVLGFSYSSGNEKLIQLFDEIAEIVLEDLVIALKEQDFSRVLLLEIFGYTTYDGQKIFSSVYTSRFLRHWCVGASLGQMVGEIKGAQHFTNGL